MISWLIILAFIIGVIFGLVIVSSGKKALNYISKEKISEINELKESFIDEEVGIYHERVTRVVPSECPTIDMHINTSELSRCTSKGEIVCRRSLEAIYSVAFNKARPNFMKNPATGRNLELDCYNDELKLAAEYNGRQHYIYPTGFNITREEFEKQNIRDKLKRRLCDDHGVFLITIPYTVKLSDIPMFIWDRIPENLYEVVE